MHGGFDAINRLYQDISIVCDLRKPLRDINVVFGVIYTSDVFDESPEAVWPQIGSFCSAAFLGTFIVREPNYY